MAMPGSGLLQNGWQRRAQAGAVVKLQLVPERVATAAMVDGPVFVMVMQDMLCMFHHVLEHTIRSVREMPPRCRKHLQGQEQHEKKDHNAGHRGDSRQAPAGAVACFAR
ncbi:hypothetical protein Tamer19_05620 [Cupriavidus sp. TA19]|nr:hypothetical protein Tamer19_05620 [Cupriavidus sp. TA19]